MTRTLAISLATALTTALATAAPAAAADGLDTPPPQRLAFDVTRGGKAFGRHVVDFARDGDSLTVTVDVDLQVRFGPFTPFTYRHDVREVWRDGVLETLTATTLKGGDVFGVEVERVGSTLAVTGPAYEGPASLATIPTTWWNKGVLTLGELLNTETGALMPVTVTEVGAETVIAAGRPVATTKYEVVGTTTVELWYDADGRWVKCAFDGRGARVEYTLAKTGDPT